MSADELPDDYYEPEVAKRRLPDWQDMDDGMTAAYLRGLLKREPRLEEVTRFQKDVCRLFHKECK